MKSTKNFQTSNAEMVTISRAEYEKLQAQSQRISKLEQQVAVLMEAIRLARHKQFGASSEKISEDAMEQLSFLFNEAEAEGRGRACHCCCSPQAAQEAYLYAGESP